MILVEVVEDSFPNKEEMDMAWSLRIDSDLYVAMLMVTVSIFSGRFAVECLLVVSVFYSLSA